MAGRSTSVPASGSRAILHRPGRRVRCPAKAGWRSGVTDAIESERSSSAEARTWLEAGESPPAHDPGPGRPADRSAHARGGDPPRRPRPPPLRGRGHLGSPVDRIRLHRRHPRRARRVGPGPVEGVPSHLLPAPVPDRLQGCPHDRGDLVSRFPPPHAARAPPGGPRGVPARARADRSLRGRPRGCADLRLVPPPTPRRSPSSPRSASSSASCSPPTWSGSTGSAGAGEGSGPGPSPSPASSPPSSARSTRW